MVFPGKKNYNKHLIGCKYDDQKVKPLLITLPKRELM